MLHLLPGLGSSLPGKGSLGHQLHQHKLSHNGGEAAAAHASCLMLHDMLLQCAVMHAEGLQNGGRRGYKARQLTSLCRRMVACMVLVAAEQTQPCRAWLAVLWCPEAPALSGLPMMSCSCRMASSWSASCLPPRGCSAASICGTQGLSMLHKQAQCPAAKAACDAGSKHPGARLHHAPCYRKCTVLVQKVAEEAGQRKSAGWQACKAWSATWRSSTSRCWLLTC